MNGFSALPVGAVDSILQAMQDIAYIKDQNGIFRGGSPAFLAAVQRSMDGIVDRTDAELYCPMLTAENAASDMEVLARGLPVHQHHWRTRADGRKVLFDIQKSRLTGPDGQPAGLLVVCHEITDQANVGPARTSTDNFETFFETIDDMIVIANPQGNILYINQAVTRELGYTMADLATAHVLDLNPPDKRDEAVQILGDMFAGKRTFCPLPIVRKDGLLLPAETRVWFGRWDGEDSLFAMVKDISKEQELLQKFNKVFDLNPALMAISTSKERVFRDVNQSFLRVLGYEREDVIGSRRGPAPVRRPGETGHDHRGDAAGRACARLRAAGAQKVRRNLRRAFFG